MKTIGINMDVRVYTEGFEISILVLRIYVLSCIYMTYNEVFVYKFNVFTSNAYVIIKTSLSRSLFKLLASRKISGRPLLHK